MRSLLALCLLSAAVVGLRALPDEVGSWWGSPLEYLAAPGITVWWFTLGGPFQTLPRTAPGWACAALANALLWWLVVVFVGAVVRRSRGRVRRKELQ